jgi:hypothetical protein
MNLELTTVLERARHPQKICLQEAIRRDLDYLTFLTEDDMATPEGESNLAAARAYVIEITVKSHVKNGLTPEAARARVEEALDAPWVVELPSFEDL